MTPLTGRRLSPALARLGITLRPETAADAAWLAALYADTRDDIARAPWPEVVRGLVVAEQFRLQRAHHAAHHPAADALVVLTDAVPVGRLLVDRTTAPWRLVDIAIDPLHRGRGIGAALIRWLQREGRAAGIDLHVLRANPAAARLYARLGFHPAAGGSFTHARLAWRIS